MLNLTRRHFLFLATGSLFTGYTKPSHKIMTVTGPIDINELGMTLTHEHVLVDFIGADKTNPSRWNKEEVVKKTLPYFMEAKKLGVQTVFECTPAFLGRDPELLKKISEQSGVRIVTNTGYYGAVGNKYLPAWAHTETAEQLAERWINEFENGIEETNIRPGFIKISVDAPAEGLSELHKKLARAAAITHKRTGLTINSHTGPAAAALEEIDILKKEGVAPDAFVWVHAQAEQDNDKHIQIAKMGAWVSLDNISNDFDKYAVTIALLKKQEVLSRTLISHDAGYYRPEEPGGGEYTGYTDIFKQLLPRLRNKGFTREDIDQLLVKNPAEAMALRVRA